MGKKDANTTANTTGDTSVAAAQNKPKDPKVQTAKVHLLNGASKDFELHRGSDGEALFGAVSDNLSIKEREYFSLSFFDENGVRHWLYNDKKILKQLKGLPWEFSYEVKFYPTAPTALNDENARYSLFLQLKKDVASGRLPATIPTHALLSALVAQAEYGDADATAEYERYLRDTVKIPNMKESEQLTQLSLIDKVKELHKAEKGLTAPEAESKYLDTCKQLSMYGVFVFEAQDNDNGKIGVGICATGINIYKETIRVHRFPWQHIIKISYRKNNFTIKLKAGELEKKEATLNYKVQDYLAAKRVWKCGVEHHTFFRLIQPDEKPKGGLFRWGSTRFRYSGRTQFQAKMASQMFENQGGTVPRSTSARLTQSFDNGLNKENMTYDEKSATLGSSPITSPGVSYDINSAKKSSEKKKKSKGKSADTSSSSSSDEEVKAVVEQTHRTFKIGSTQVETFDVKTRSVSVYESDTPSEIFETVGEAVSSKTVTLGNRTIETTTYKRDHNGVIETHLSHRVTINSDVPIDHDAELELALTAATQMNPDMRVDKIEVRQEAQA